MNTQQAIKAIVAMQILPPQIDYVSPGKQKEYELANKFIKALPYAEKISANAAIAEQLDAYYGENGAAQYDSMF